MQERFWEIDAVRGLAVVLMVTFNWAFVLQYFRIFTADGGWLFWWLFPRAIASMFIIIAGISFTISYSRAMHGKKQDIHKKYLFRGGKIFALGLLATAATWIFVPQGTIFFGILHFVGIAIMIAPLFIKLRRWNILLAVIFITAGIYFQSLSAGYPWLLWLGIAPASFNTLDYFPLLPWLGVFLTGLFLGTLLYKNGKRIFRLSNKIQMNPLGFLGRHSLLIYVLHQPLLIALLYATGHAVF